MKRTMLFSCMLFLSYISYSQTLYDILDLDDCRSFNVIGNSNTTSAATTNPDATDALTNPNVFGVTPSANNGHVRVQLPFSIPVGTSINFSLRAYSEHSFAEGSGRFIFRLYNTTVGTGTYDNNVIRQNKAGGWQTVSTTGYTTAVDNGAGDVAGNGGFNAILIIVANGGNNTEGNQLETLYLDDFQMSINPVTVLSDDTADLDSGKVWLYDNRTGNFKASLNASGLTVEENAATPSTNGNASSTVLKITRGSTSNASLRFNHADINYSTAGTAKFRIYPECKVGSDPDFRYFLRKDNSGSTQRVSTTFSLTPNVWNEVEVDLSTLTVADQPATIFDDSIIFFNQADQATSSGAIYYIDAFQIAPSSATYNGNGTDFTTDTNWDSGVTPNALYNVTIPSGLSNQPEIGASSGITVNDLTVDGSSTLTIASGGSLIVAGNSTGNVTYQVAANDTNWHLLSSPVESAVYNGTWVNDNDIDNTNRTVGTNIGISWYSNTVDADGDWTFAEDADSGTFNTGQGYSFKRDATTNSFLSFAGTIKTDALTNTINQGTNNWNLKGNPYTSYILVSDLISDNAANLTDTHENVYIWNGSTYTALSSNDYIHPGQGFFVNAANSTADNFTIDASKLSHQTGVTLYKGSSKTAITLSINDGKNVKSTEINYVVDKTTGLDPSYDVGTFTGAPTTFSIYSHLVNNSKGVDFMRQALPNSDYESMVIPIGINADTGREITFSAEALNLPDGIKVFLEDREKNTFTRLDEANSEYTITINTALSGIGRFYLHTTTQSVLSIDKGVASESISIYKTNTSTLRIVGLQQGKASVKLFNIIGKQVMNSSFESNGTKDVSLPNLAKGIYIVQLSTDTYKLNKKIILE